MASNLALEAYLKKNSVNSFSSKCFHSLINEKTSCVIAFENKPVTKNINNKFGKRSCFVGFKLSYKWLFIVLLSSKFPDFSK